MKFNFQELVVVEQLSKITGLSNKDIIWIAKRSFLKNPNALTASGYSKMSLKDFENNLNKAIFQYQIEELDAEFEAEIMTLIASAIDPLSPQVGKNNPNPPSPPRPIIH